MVVPPFSVSTASLPADDQHPQRISDRLLAQRKQKSWSQLKREYLESILTLAASVPLTELPMFLRTAAHTPLARWQTGWRFACCFWRPRSKTQLFLLQLAEQVERATPFTHALTLQNYRNIHFCLTQALSIFIDNPQANAANEIIILRYC